jgi:hypothetical protein
VKSVNWSDFRDHIATADRSGKRKWVYPRKVAGLWFRWRTWFSWLLLIVMFAGPFITIRGNPLLMMNIPDRKFVVLGQIFWPQDMILFALAVLVGVIAVVIFTTAFGRLWCGWACPQTVMMEMVFRKIEYFIEGDAPEQRELNAAPWNGRKIFKKLFKHAVFFALSFLVGNVLLSYIIGWQQLYQIIVDPPAKHVVGLGFMTAFSLAFSPGSANRPALLFVPTAGCNRCCWTKIPSSSPTITSAVRSAARSGALSGLANAATRASAIVWRAIIASPSAPPALISETARRWNACIAPPAWTPVTM